MPHNPTQHSNAPDRSKASLSHLKGREQRSLFRIRYVHHDGSLDHSFDLPPDEEPREPFGALIKEARKSLHLRLADVAPQIFKRNGQPISVPFLHDLEQSRCAPALWLIPQLADVLNIPEDILYFVLGRLPPDFYQPKLPHERILHAFQVFRAALEADDESPM